MLGYVGNFPGGHPGGNDLSFPPKRDAWAKYQFHYEEDRSDKDLVSRVGHASYAWPYASCPRLLAALDTGATGRIEVKWTPAALENANIINMGTSNNITYTHLTELITVTDGTNTITAAHTAVVGTAATITIDYDQYGMSLEVV